MPKAADPYSFQLCYHSWRCHSSPKAQARQQYPETNVNAAAGTTLKNTASVEAKTQDVVP